MLSQHTLPELQELYPSFDSLQARLSSIYAEREAEYLPDQFSRIRLFNRSAYDLFDAMREIATPENLETYFARMTARVICIANGAGKLSIAEGLCIKFPLEGCGYCGHEICVCGKDRGSASHTTGVIDDRKNWNLAESGELESGEEARLRSQSQGFDLEYAKEIADAMAWTIAVANMKNVDLEKATLNRFGNGCLRCESQNCSCGPFNMNPVELD